MSVRLGNWKDAEGKEKAAWLVDVAFEHADGRVQRVKKFSPVNTRRGAEEYERQIRASPFSGEFGREVIEGPTLREFEERVLTYSVTNNKPSAVEAKRPMLKNHIVPAFGDTKLEDITVEKVETYKAAKLRDGLARKTINNHLAALRKLLNLAVEWGALKHAPKIRALKLAEQTFEFLTFDEANRFQAAAEPEWAAMLTTAAKTGLRIGELLALKWEDVDLHAGRLVVRRTVWNGIEGPPKGGKSREVPLSPAAAATLKAHRHLRGAYVFCHADDSTFTHSGVKKVVPRACRRAGLSKRLTWHDLRHTFASHLVMRGVPLKAVQELLGHAMIDMTMRYAHLSPDIKRDAVLMLDALVNGPYAAHDAGKKKNPLSYQGVSGAGKGI